MKEILEFVERHFAQLSQVDWGVVLVLSFLIGSGLFLVFRWLFESRLEAHRGLLELRTKESDELRSKIARQSEEVNSLSRELLRLAERHSAVAIELRAALIIGNTTDEIIGDLIDYIVHLRAVLLLARVYFAEYKLLTCSLKKLAIYGQPEVQRVIRSGPPASVVLSRLGQAFDEAGELPRSLEHLTSGVRDEIDITIRIDLAGELQKLENRQVTKELSFLEQQMDQVFARIEQVIREQR